MSPLPIYQADCGVSGEDPSFNLQVHPHKRVSRDRKLPWPFAQVRVLTHDREPTIIFLRLPTLSD